MEVHMYIEGFEQWFKLNRNLSTPLSDWSKTTTELFRRTAQQHLEIMEENFSRWSDQIKRLSNVKKPEDFLNLQKDCMSENMNATLENIQKLTQISMKNVEELSKLCVSFREPITPKSMDKEREKERSK